MRRLHPFSAAQQVVARAVQVGAFGFFLGVMAAGPLELVPFWLTFVLGALGALAGGAYGVARYLRFAYETEGDTLAVASGVFNRRERSIPLGRIQNVDVNRNPLHRVLGLAVVRFETAGGGSTEAVLDAVSLGEARRLQEFVAAHGRRSGPDSSAAPDDEVQIEERLRTTDGPRGDRRVPSPLYELGTRDLLVLGVATAVPAAPILVVISTPFLGDFALAVVSATSEALGGPAEVSLSAFPTYDPGDFALVAGIVVVEFALVTWLLSAALTVLEYYDFTLTSVDDELRYERGLLGRYSGSIPVEKIQTVTIRETAPMRVLGYAALSVETAGYGPDASDGRAANTAIPLDDRETVVELAESLGEFEYVEPERPPRRARRRYAVRYSLVPVGVAVVLRLVDALVVPFSWWYVPLTVVPIAAVVGNLTWRNRGHALAEDVFLARSGFWRRSTRAVPYDRVQTVIGKRTVFQRYRSLASVTADTASSSSLLGGDATAHDVDEGTAGQLHTTLRDRLASRVREREHTDP